MKIVNYTKQNDQGFVYSITDGIVLISGMKNAAAGDMLTLINSQGQKNFSYGI